MIPREVLHDLLDLKETTTAVAIGLNPRRTSQVQAYWHNRPQYPSHVAHLNWFRVKLQRLPVSRGISLAAHWLGHESEMALNRQSRRTEQELATFALCSPTDLRLEL
jgi:hypothetical protein